ncbi:hypothetical protein MUK42_35981 [Musa troglodytarum]|uniref:Uncharacterized protein n=1 Tax=Musa troglodytarum TaxID=320322 RepID=A0A9E7ED46_9LILI|nr:hypothetical protein MUK42_35981 [Musa troglodytarum]
MTRTGIESNRSSWILVRFRAISAPQNQLRIWRENRRRFPPFATPFLARFSFLRSIQEGERGTPQSSSPPNASVLLRRLLAADQPTLTYSHLSLARSLARALSLLSLPLALWAEDHTRTTPTDRLPLPPPPSPPLCFSLFPLFFPSAVALPLLLRPVACRESSTAPLPVAALCFFPTELPSLASLSESSQPLPKPQHPTPGRLPQPPRQPPLLYFSPPDSPHPASFEFNSNF